MEVISGEKIVKSYGKFKVLTAEGEAYLQEFIKCWTEVQSSVNRILKKEE